MEALREQAREEARAILRLVRQVPGGADDNFAMNSADQIIAQFDRIGALIFLATIALAAVSLAIGGIGIANTLTLNVLERRREIGVMRAIGAGDTHLVQAFMTEAVALGGGGFVLGALLGYPLTWLFVTLLSSVLFPMQVSFPPENVILAAGFTLLLTLVASIGPALGAARLRVREALRYE